ncbi:MAG: 50S ribosomal protein L3 N(5)-glutamine methyltransferase [Xanthomonadales bacterium]
MNVAQWTEWVCRELDGAELHFGHGTDNARDEAAWLVLHAVSARLDGSFDDWGRELDGPEEKRLRALLDARITQKLPLAYLTGMARFAGLEFATGRAALVPRSPIAELVLERFQPWVDPARVGRVLDMCTGSGCIAIAIACNMPWTRVDAVDISPGALEIAARNVRRHAVDDRVNLIESDLFRSLPGRRYELIVANPPYVPVESINALPDEYRAEPVLGLVSGSDGLNATLSILMDAPRFLSQNGVLVCEVGESKDRLLALLPELPFLWLDFSAGGSGVFVLKREELEHAGELLAALLEERNNVT